MVIEGWRGWGKVALVGALAALLAFFALVEVRQVLLEREQLRQIVALIQQGRIQVGPPPPSAAPAPPAPSAGQAPPQAPAEKPKQ